MVNTPWWPFIKKCDIKHYLKQLEEKVIAKSTYKKVVIAELEAIDEDIKKSKKQLEIWIKLMDGQKLAELQLKTKEQDKVLKEGVTGTQTFIMVTAVEVKEWQRLTKDKKEYKTNKSKGEQKKKDLKQPLKLY